jgi:hypothetical protein
MFRKIFLFQLFFIGALIQVKASQIIADSSAKNDEPTRDFIIGLDMGNNRVYKGVKQQEQQQLYVSPSASYYAKKGFFITFAGYYLTNTTYNFDELDGTVGWDFNLFKKQLKASISYSKYVFNANSPDVNASLTNNVEFYLKKKFSWIKTKLAFDYSYGTATDFYIKLDNSHSFDWDDVFTKDDELSFIPKISLTYGTENYYRNVVKQKVKKTTKAQTDALNKELDKEVTQFVFTSFDLTLPLLYSIGNVDIEPAFRYSRAFNQPKSLNGIQSPNTAYITLSLSYTF